MHLLQELYQPQALVEAVGNKKYYYLEGVWMQSEIKNRNGRIYPKAIMESGVSRYMIDHVARKTAYGELGHSDKPNIDPGRISHLIESLSWDGNDVIGRAKILDTDPGLTAQKIIEGGGQLGVSSKALGSLRESQGAMYVQADFRLTTAGDIVVDPSAPKAFVNSILEETDWWYNEITGEFSKRNIEESTKLLRDMKKPLREEHTLSLFNSFLKTLSSKH